ncbi:polysaccharide deacetylase family protein [Halomicroarcula sp. S1AR25-4]|uniref:polysaccharide deacetylase family protein n=1 Tax=Haloarcula sp. S1AR25-4 TaxID=2950538 RepID=UPI002876E8A7|nr:polysaccharide deacetylase family protein [Halomicroarcula sp. S1AR25-4]MDS0278467.1 polysaccharide deacetylase family protein [Halomicroarcula sp. S1AR25-4]
MSDRPGAFVVSLDTELAWGTFDVGKIDRYEPAYREARGVVEDLCTLFDEYEVPATWAVVAHLLEDCGGVHAAGPEPTYPWVDGWHDALPCRTGVDRDLWYAPDIVDRIRSCTVDHEIGLHGYTHVLLGESGCHREAAEREVGTAMAVANDHGLDPQSYVFPRNRIGHRDVLADAGIDVYRGRDARWFERWSLPSLARKPPRYLEEALHRTPPSVWPREREGLLELPGSQVFRPYHDGWQWTHPDSQRRRAVAGLNRAAATGGIFHLRFHPFDLGFDRERLLGVFESILAHAESLSIEGALVPMTMSDAATEYHAER